MYHMHNVNNFFQALKSKTRPWTSRPRPRPNSQGQGQGQGLESQGQGQGQGLKSQGQGQGFQKLALRPDQGQGQDQGLTSLVFLRFFFCKNTKVAKICEKVAKVSGFA